MHSIRLQIKLVGYAVVGTKRTQEFNETMNSLQSIGIFGIATTCTEWIFSRTFSENGSSKVKIVKSEIYTLPISTKAIESEIGKAAMKEQLKTLLKIIVYIVLFQKSFIDIHPLFNNKNHLQTKLNAEEREALGNSRGALNLNLNLNLNFNKEIENGSKLHSDDDYDDNDDEDYVV
jgi:hypothetical protein